MKLIFTLTTKITPLQVNMKDFFYLKNNSTDFSIEIIDGKLDVHSKGIENLYDYFRGNFDKHYNLHIPEGVRSIGDHVFGGLNTLVSIEFPYSLQSIKDCAFSKCINLVSLILPYELKKIGSSAFSECLNLKSIEFHQNLRCIGKDAFYECINLENIIFHENLRIENIGSNLFRGCPSLQKIIINNPNKKLFDKVYDIQFNQYTNGLTLLQFALRRNNYILAINTLLNYGADIRCSSLPKDLKAELFPNLNPNDFIDIEKVLEKILKTGNALEKIYFIKSKEMLVDNIIRRFMNQKKLGDLKKLKEQEKKTKAEGLSLKLFETIIEQRTRHIVLSETFSFQSGLFQPFLNYKDLKAVFSTSRVNTLSFSRVRDCPPPNFKSSTLPYQNNC